MWSGAFSKASECLGLPRPIQGITLRLAHGEEQSCIDLQSGFSVHKDVSKRSVEAFGNFRRGSFPTQVVLTLCACVCWLEELQNTSKCLKQEFNISYKNDVICLIICEV